MLYTCEQTLAQSKAMRNQAYEKQAMKSGYAKHPLTLHCSLGNDSKNAIYFEVRGQERTWKFTPCQRI